ncbi:MAG: hypothetical protein E7249_05160 [Paenibacillaceae bacterium]|nr:hypothetical protein [Paenibacillaceae bacterium]
MSFEEESGDQLILLRFQNAMPGIWSINVQSMEKEPLATPGHQIPCALPGNPFGTLTGTGAATAHATGSIAMILEWGIPRGNYTTLSGNVINSLITRGALRESSIIYRNNIWGYGMSDVMNCFNDLPIFRGCNIFPFSPLLSY